MESGAAPFSNNIRKMVQRKTHAKSRLGCLTCKRRHVKCNESRPKCDKCLKLGLSCEWAPKLDESSSPATTAISPAEQAYNSSPILGLADLRLLHHWLRHTAPATFLDGDTILPWLDDLVELGFEHTYLLHAMLAVAAVHKAIGLDESDDLSLQASTHFDIAVRSLQAYIKQPDSESYAPIFATASLMVVYKLGVAQVEVPGDPVAETCDWIRLLRGVSTVVQQFAQRLHNTAMGALLGAPPMGETTGEIPDVIRLGQVMLQLHQAEAAESCLRAVTDLHTVLLSLEQDTTRPPYMTRRLILSWPMRQSPIFIDLLCSKDPAALIILAHYAVVFHACGSQWIMRNWAGWILDAVRAEVDVALHSWLIWPAQVLQEPALANVWHWPRS